MGNNLSKNQRGMVSLMVTLIMMLVISLIVLGFAQVTRRNQREALDRQLSTQAYYAAETGVNDTIKKIQGDPANGIAPYNPVALDKTDCKHLITAPPILTPNLDPSGSAVAYTCLLVDPTPSQLIKKPLNAGSNTVWQLTSADNSNIQTLVFTWKNDSASGKGTSCPLAGQLPPADSWTCSYPILRVDLVQAAPGAVVPGDLQQNNQTGTIFMLPGGGTSSANFNPALPTNKGLVVGTQCAGGSCTLTLNMPDNSPSYYARLSTIYGNSDSVSVKGTTDTGTLHFIGGQTLIDATGRAQDVLRRIQVRVEPGGGANNPPLPLNALQSTAGICKYFTIAPGDTEATFALPGDPSCDYTP